MTTEVNVFEIIKDFVNELHSFYGTKQKSLALYHRLITRASTSELIQAHIERFKKFCIQNRVAIAESNPQKFVQNKIIFSGSVYIDIGLILSNSKSPANITSAIWKYLLTFSALLDTESKAKELLKTQPKESEITEIFGDLVESIKTDLQEANITPSDNPMEMVSTLLKSGALTKIMDNFQTKMESGELDLNKLMGMAQHMMGDMMQQAGGDPLMQGMMMNLMANMPAPPSDE